MKKINQLDPASITEAIDDGRLFAQADPTGGVAKKMTVAQAKIAFGTFTVLYTATGGEGTVITVPAISGKKILSVFREGQILYQVASSPDTTEFTNYFNAATITLGLATNPGERFLILYKTP